MFSILTNIISFFIFSIILLFEYILATFLNIDTIPLFLSTVALYSIFIIYQVIVMLFYYFELNKVKQILEEIINSIKGIPIINKDDEIIIKWDIIFKNLTETKNYTLYDKIVKFKTKKITAYINRHPSILFDNTFMEEYVYNKNLKSFITKDKSKDKENEDLEVSNHNLKNILYISDIKERRITFVNYDSSIIIDFILINEYEPEDYEKLNVEPNPRYDGLSMKMYYNNKKYCIIPRIMLYNKEINKNKWFFDNIDLFHKLASKFIESNQNIKYELNENLLSDYTKDMPRNPLSYKPTILFHSLINNNLVFKNIEFDKNPMTISCSIEIDNNSYEIILKEISKDQNDKKEMIEINKTIAVGTSYEPIITIFENLPEIIKNIELIINNKELENIVF